MAPALRAPVVPRQDKAFADVFFKDARGERTHKTVIDQGILRRPEIGVELPMNEIYVGVGQSRCA